MWVAVLEGVGSLKLLRTQQIVQLLRRQQMYKLVGEYMYMYVVSTCQDGHFPIWPE